MVEITGAEDGSRAKRDRALGPKLMISNLICCFVAILIDVGISREGYLELLLACIGVLVTLVALILALAGVVGFASLRQASTEAAAKAAKDSAEQFASQALMSELDLRIGPAVEQAVAQALKDRQGAELSSQQVNESMAKKVKKQAADPVSKPPRRARKDSDLRDREV